VGGEERIQDSPARCSISSVVIVVDNDGYTVERAIHRPEESYNDSARWDWTALAALEEVLIAHDPVTMLGQQRVKRTIRQRAHQHRRIKHPDLNRLSGKHARKGLKPTGQTTTFSGAF
jgi:TPP-dependent 2-oxoacid decarboxylase